MRLLIVDTTGYLFRAYHAIGDLRTHDNRPTGAIWATLTMLDKLRRRYPAERVVCVTDAGGKTFRHEMDGQYKANRPPPPPDLQVQFTPLNDFIKAWGWPLLSIAGVEADDVIATLAKQATAAGMETIIASTDKDLMQLADESVTLYDGMKDRIYDSAGVREKFGVTPAQIADYLALVGDSSDNIPGVERVGAKTAAKWLNAHGNLTAIIAAAADISGAVGASLRAAVDNGRLALSRRLVALKDDVKLPLTVEQLTRAAIDEKRWRALCETYEFRRVDKFLEDVSVLPVVEAEGAVADAGKAAVEIINDEENLKRWIADIRAAGRVAIDTETVGEPVMAAKLVGFSLSVNGDCAAYVPLRHTELGARQLPPDLAIEIIREVLEDETIVKITHNGKYDWHVFANVGISVAGIIEDTKIAAYVDNAPADSTLAALASSRLKAAKIRYQDLVDGKVVKDFAAVPITAAADYAAEDAWVTRRLDDVLIQPLSGKAAEVYRDLDRPLMPVLAMIERAGMKIDRAALECFATAMRAEMEILEKRAHTLAGEPFNLNSPRQLETLLFDKQGAAPVKKTGGGARSTDERTLEKLAADFPLAATLLEYRTLAKLVGTYAEKLPRLILPQSGRVHTTFSQTAVFTGRLSSSSPNLQNIPIRTEAGRQIRRAFIADAGQCLISADYSQIELRIMAHISGDTALLAAFASGEDIHRRTASEVFGVTAEEVSFEQRRAAKAINFGLIYGMSAFGLARNLNITQAQAQVYIDRYFGRYPAVAAYMAKIRKVGVEQGVVETAFGRRIPLLVTRGGRPALERVAINAPIQGSAADLMKKAMLNVAEWLQSSGVRSQMILQVHDELVLETDEQDADTVCAELPRLMQAMPLAVPLEVSVHRGSNWDEAH